MKKILGFCLVMIILLVGLTGCGNENVIENSTSTSTSNSTSENTKKVGESKMVNINYEEAAKKQLSAPEKGEQIAIFHIQNFGDIKVKFFKDVAPKAVENFITHSQEGYYNGLTFHRVINEFMIQGGDPKGNGTGGESIWGTDFEEELADELVPYRGSLCMASRGLQNSPSLGSQFFITQGNYDEQMESYLKSYGYSDELIEQYKNYGGYISLYKQYTVFGQVYEGMDIVDKIAGVDTDENDKPLQDVIIESIEVTVVE